MFEIMNPTPDVGDNKSQNARELQNVYSVYWLNGKKYIKWSQLIKIILKGKGKVGPSKRRNS